MSHKHEAAVIESAGGTVRHLQDTADAGVRSLRRSIRRLRRRGRKAFMATRERAQREGDRFSRSPLILPAAVTLLAAGAAAVGWFALRDRR